MISKAVILCGGLATRFLPVTKSIPKEMLPILNRPAIDYCIEDLKKNGITDVLIILGRNKECIENYFDRNIELEDRLEATNKYEELKQISHIYNDINITFTRQIYARGTGYAVTLAKNFVGEDNFILMFPDELNIGESITKQLITTHLNTKTSVIPLKQIPIDECVKYGMVAIEENSKGLKITNIIEKPTIENTPSDVCYTGGGLFTSEIFDCLKFCSPHSNGEIYLTDAFNTLMQSNKLYGALIEGERIDFGTPLGFVKGNVIAGIKDQNIKDELLEFLQDIVNNN